MSQFRFEKQRVSASLTLTTGGTVSGCFFVVSPLAQGGPERVGDLLNAYDGFFPFEDTDGVTRLYNRAHIVLVKLAPGTAEVNLEPGHSVALERFVGMTLSTGTIIEGTVFIDRPPGRDRLSDCVRDWKRFLYIVTSTDTLVVNTHHVVELVEIST